MLAVEDPFAIAITYRFYVILIVSILVGILALCSGLLFLRSAVKNRMEVETIGGSHNPGKTKLRMELVGPATICLIACLTLVGTVYFSRLKRGTEETTKLDRNGKPVATKKSSLDEFAPNSPKEWTKSLMTFIASSHPLGSSKNDDKVLVAGGTNESNSTPSTVEIQDLLRILNDVQTDYLDVARLLMNGKLTSTENQVLVDYLKESRQFFQNLQDEDRGSNLSLRIDQDNVTRLQNLSEQRQSIAGAQ